MTSNLTFPHSVFYPFGELSIVIKFETVVCKLSVGKNKKFVAFEVVNISISMFTV